MMPNEPTLLRQSTPSKPTFNEAVSGNIRAEASQRQITRADLKRSLGWSEHKMRSRWEGRKLTVVELFTIGLALEVEPFDFMIRMMPTLSDTTN